MIAAYHGFFTASASASAAFLGLLFVSIAFIDSEKVDETTRVWRRIIANSSFAQLVDIFFVSMASLLPDHRSFAVVGIVMAALGIWVAIRLLPHVINGGRPGRGSPSSLGMIAVAAYILQLITAISLLQSPNSQSMLNYFVLAIIILYAGALARAWEITGIRKR